MSEASPTLPESPDLPLKTGEPPVAFLELIGVICGAALLTYLGWVLKCRLRARRLRARVSMMESQCFLESHEICFETRYLLKSTLCFNLSAFSQIAAGDFPPGYTVTRGGRLRPPPRTWRGRMTVNNSPRDGVSLQQMDRVAPAFQGECQSAEGHYEEEVLIESKTSRNLESHECTICLEEMKILERKRKLPCKHFYHAHCIESWAVKNNACPNCRSKIFDAGAGESPQSPTESVGIPSFPQGRTLTDNSSGRAAQAMANASFVTARLDTTNTQANSRFWISPRARDNVPVPDTHTADPAPSSFGSLGMTFATAREFVSSPSRPRSSPKMFSVAETENETAASAIYDA